MAKHVNRVPLRLKGPARIPCNGIVAKLRKLNEEARIRYGYVAKK